MTVPTLHSTRHDADLPLGAVNIDAPPHPDFTPYESLRPGLKAAGVLPTIPQMFGHGHSLPQGAWRMLGNGPDNTVFPGFGGAGDCVIAERLHSTMSAALNAGRPLPQFSGATAIKQYSEATLRENGEAYDSHTEAGDTGLDPQEELKHQQEEGVYDDHGTIYKIGQVLSLKAGDVQQMWEAAYLLETASLWINVQEAQEQQFNERAQPTWEYVAGSPELGGHAVLVVGKIGLLSWAEDVYWTPKFLQHQMTGGAAFIDPLRYSAVTGQTAEHWKDQDLEKFIVEVARMKALA